MRRWQRPALLSILIGWAAGFGTVSAAPPANAVADGSFELGPPPASAWTETCTLVCERIGEWSSDWYVNAYDGLYDYWAGGYCDDGQGQSVPVTSSVSQTVALPADSTTLSFYYIAYRPAGDDSPLDGDHAYIAVNGTEVWTLPLTQASNTYPSWVGPVTVNLAAYAGEDILLTFGGVSEGEATGNLRFDKITLLHADTPAETCSWGRLKSLYQPE